ncbi:hypothetical protein Thu_106 [Bacillus phage Thurquoise]|uniref:Uncharacterized protein n=1 Tax=Bacillus phage Deep Blue TaxID=1792245 RepID=A0A140HLZ4_9CAUD|nr:hypothetical protein Blue_183 [Bacillus phage Deep Blue]AMO26006.1 hypothetical protein Blue_183 [Bacillus phage Deep Blue]UXQ88949.1 hypothetical protein Thu_106 [Bacillus phage Thurquoise]
MEQQPQGKPINPKHIVNEQKVLIFDLMNENIMLKSYIAQLEEDKVRMQEELAEPKKSAEPKE